MGAGKYRDRITIREDVSLDGDPNPDYDGNVIVVNRPARVNDIGGQSTFRGQQVEERITTIVEMRDHPEIKSNMRIEFGTRLLNINYFKRVRFGGTPVELHLFCTEIL